MDKFLAAAWKLKERPFHAETIVATDLLSISQLRQILDSILGHCELCYPHHYTTLYTMDDCYEHDGCITDRRLTTFQDLYSILDSDESLYGSSHKDNDVYHAIYPDSMDFLIRYDLLVEGTHSGKYPEICADFSFTGYGFDLFEIKKRLSSISNIKLKMINSVEYFNNRYSE